MVTRKIAATIRGHAGAFTKAMAVETIKRGAAPHVPKYLDDIGVAHLKTMVTKNISLWSVWPDDGKTGRDTIIAKLSEYREIIPDIDEGEVLAVLREIVTEQCPRYNFLTDEWVLQGLKEIKEAVLNA